MEKIGVEAVVENMGEFTRNMTKMNNLVEDFGKTVEFVGRTASSGALSGLGATIGAAAPQIGALISVLDILDGVMRKVVFDTGIFDGAIELVGKGLKSLGSIAFDAGKAVVRTVGDIIGKVVQIPINILRSFGDSLKRIGEIAFGIIVADNLRRIGDMIIGMGRNALQAAEDFQVLTIRLEGILKNEILSDPGFGARSFELIEKGIDPLDVAFDEAGIKAQELLGWIQLLGVQTPFSVQEIAKTFTLAVSYGNTSEAAKDLTQSIIDFAAGMGLSDIAMTRIIENFGQMQQQGKITGTELRDLGRGAFVPVNALLNKTAELMGFVADGTAITAKELNKFAGEQGLDPVQTMMQAFMDLVGERFAGAAKRMSETMMGVRNNVADLIEVIGGSMILGPSMDAVAAGLDKIIKTIISDPLVRKTAEALGDTLGKLVGDIVDKFPSANKIADKFAKIMKRILRAVDDIRQRDFRGAMEALGIPEPIIEGVERFAKAIQAFQHGDLRKTMEALGVPDEVAENVLKLIEAFENLKTFWDENGDELKGAIEASLNAILAAFGIDAEVDLSGSIGELVDKFLEWSQTLDTEDIVGKLQVLTLQAILFIEKVDKLIEKLPFLAFAFITLRHPIVGVGIAFGVVGGLILEWLIETQNKIDEWVEDTTVKLITWAVDIVTKLREKITDMIQAGKDLLEGLFDGMKSYWDQTLKPWLEGIAEAALGLWDKITGSNSPSTEMEKRGAWWVEGLLGGIEKMLPQMNSSISSMAQQAIQAGEISRPVASTSTVNNVTNINFTGNYTEQQSAIRDRDDIAVLLAFA